MTTVAFGVLGPLEAVGEHGPISLRGPRHRAVLARLLVARGRVVPVDRLVEDLWEEPGEGAVSALRTFVSDLRRALEPGRPPREPARLLVTAAPGYALRAAADAVDAWRFEAAVGEAGRLLADGRPAAPPGGPAPTGPVRGREQAERALACLDGALALWRGPAYAENAGEEWASSEIHRLDELLALAVERRARALLALGRSAEAVSDLEAHAGDRPLREDAWHLLATALYRSGRQADALAALRRVRETLVTELGVDPGPRLRRLESDILTQAPHLTQDDPAPVRAPEPAAGGRVFVGREGDLARLEEAAGQVAGRGGPGVVLVSGEAGAGKTALAEAVAARLAARGWVTAWGRSPEYEGAPVAAPWTQVTGALPPPPEPDRPGPEGSGELGSDGTGSGGPGSGGLGSGGLGPDGGGRGADPAVVRFRRHRAVVARVAGAAAGGPVLVVLDDLHRADADTLDLLTAVATAPEVGPVLVVGTFRTTEVGPELTSALARLARTEPVRVYLGGLTEAATGELAGAVTGREPAGPVVRLIHRRSGGNPFFVRELARLFAAEGEAGLEAVPAGVRDVIRHRLAQLPEETRTVLMQAAVAGRDVDPEVLAELAGEGPMLDAVERALRAGFLTERGGLRFTHILVRDTLYGDLSALRRARWHAAVGEAVERLHPDDVAALAHHFTLAAGGTVSPRAARYARAAAELAERRSDPHEAARLWRQVITHTGGDAVRDRLEADLGLGRALAVTGRMEEARRLRAEAVDTAESLGDADLTAAVITAFGVPAVWTRNDDERLSARIAAAAERTLAALSGDPAAPRDVMGRLWSALALELRGTTSDRGRRAAREAEAIARASGDRASLALALNARFMHAFGRAGLAGERARIGAELVELTAGGELVTFEVLGRLVQLQARAALGDLAAADAHAEAADALASRYELPLVGVFTAWYAGLRHAVAGRPEEAAAAYRDAQARLAGSGMPGMEEGLLPLALLALRLTTGRDGDAGSWRGRDYGPYEPWVRPLILLDAGRREEAAAALRGLPESPHDLMREARLCLAARAAVALGERAVMARLRRELAPAAGELAGAGSGVLTLGPVAGYLDDLVTGR
ncbi:BTAD domain-containing putative transcriptional regulator [Nonomuraea ceibae]|uniref:BTAD domain-containing putative transcriptional regulator n=1 Tax=Nonomuraea ceibae TaxID=1935170 RepID=UPI0027E14F1A|nr:BTAD domain-containing putative transcriptional regulator [Nonomuraea ceibae]